MAKKRGLGRGLDALLEKEVPATKHEVDPAQLHPNAAQPRSQFDEAGIEELARSIAEQGLIQPIVVTPRQAGGYTIVAGERRWRAAQKLGLQSVAIVEREVADGRQLLELALVENLQRSDLDPLEEAEAYKALQDRFGMSQEKVAARVGKSRAAIANATRLLRLPEPVQMLLRAGQITAGQARPLLALDDSQLQQTMAERIVEEGWSARRVEAEISSRADRGSGDRPVAKQKKEREVDVHTADAEERLTKRLQTKVQIHRGAKGGTVRIAFHSEEELIRVFEMLIDR